MATVESDQALSITRIAQAADLPRYVVSTLIDHFRIPVLRGPNLTAVLPEGRTTLVCVLERHPGVKPGLNDRL